MRTRQRNLTGQALVLVTLALFAMMGMMGLAVDLGWMFFLKKSAQATADAAALGAVREAKERLGGSFGGFTCPGSPGIGDAWCTTGTPPAAIDCASGNALVTRTSN